MLTMLAGTMLCRCCAFPTTIAARSSAGRFRATWVEAEPRSPPPERWTGSLRLDGANVVDPRDGSMRRDVSVLVRDGRIVAVGAAGSIEADPDVEVIGAAGKYVVPGYNDMHSHVLELEDPSGALALMLAEGVTGFRQMSGSPERLQERREGRLPIGRDAPAALEMPGTILTPLNAASEEAIRAEIRDQKAQGADFVKVGFVPAPVFLVALDEARTAGIPLLGHLQDGVDAATAAQAGFRTVEHLGPGATLWMGCSTAEAELKSEAKPVRMRAPPLNIPFLRRLIMWRLQTMLINPAAFVPPAYTVTLKRAIETFDETRFKALAARFVAEDTWHVPTLVRLRTQELADAPEYDRDPYLRFMPKAKVRKWRSVTNRFHKLPVAMRKVFAEAYPRQLELTKRLADAGVRMMVGTDGGWLSGPGLTLKEEFAELARAGLSPLKILQMATINAAEYLRRDDAMGAVAPGHAADMVILNRNPLTDVANLHDIAGVVRAGRHYPKSALDSLVAKVAATRGFLK